MDEYPSNSNTSKRKKPEIEDKKVEKVVEGKVIRRKKSRARKFKDLFFGSTARSAWTTVGFSILIPGAKALLVDAGETALRRMILGDDDYGSRRRHNRTSWEEPRHRAYDKRYSQNTPRDSMRDEPRTMSRRGRSRHDFDEIIVETRGEAMEILDQLFELIEKYGTASVADLYGMLDVNPAFTDNKYGWMDLRGSTATRVPGGYLLDLPRPEPID